MEEDIERITKSKEFDRATTVEEIRKLVQYPDSSLCYGMLADQARTSLDIVIALTQFAKINGILTVQIPRHLLDSKKPDNTGKPFAVKIDGQGIASKELQNTNTYRIIGLYFGAQSGFVEIFGSQIAR